MSVRVILNQETEEIPELKAAIAEGKAVTAEISTITGLPDGTEGGMPTVAVIGKLPDGQVVYMQATLRVMQTAMAGFAALYGDVTGGADFAIGPNEATMGWRGKKE